MPLEMFYGGQEAVCGNRMHGPKALEQEPEGTQQRRIELRSEKRGSRNSAPESLILNKARREVF